MPPPEAIEAAGVAGESGRSACVRTDSLLTARRFEPIPSGFGPVFVFESKVFPRTAIDAGFSPFGYEVVRFMQIMVRDNNVDQALRALKKKLQREGVYREMKLRRHYEKPSEKRAREKAAAVRRARKMERKRMERDGVK
jgi:small subunit ribosomal protein S21